MGEKVKFIAFPSHHFCSHSAQRYISNWSIQLAKQHHIEELTFPLCIISVLFSYFFNGNFPMFKLKE